MDFMKSLVMHIIGQILDYYNVLKLVYCCICHTCCKIRLYLPQILGQIYTWADSAHPDQEQSMLFDIWSAFWHVHVCIDE